jgi:hypothetical protein
MEENNTSKIEAQTVGIYVSNIDEPVKSHTKKRPTKKHKEPLFITHI